MMKTALFHYQKSVQSPTGERELNDNFINPLNVTSFYWQQNAEGKRVLSVFLNAVRATNNGGSNAYSIVFGDSLGTKFVDHMEDFLRYMLGFGNQTTRQDNNYREQQQHTRTRTARRAIETVDVVDEEPQNQPSAIWSDAPAN